MTQVNLTKLEVDQLKEILHIGAGNAATALSFMLGQRIETSVPESFIGGIEIVQRDLGQLDEKVVAVFFKTHGDVEGAMVMILPPTSAIDLAYILTKEKVDSLDKMEPKHLSAVQEVGNILLGASITALNKFLNINIIHSVPDTAVDMLGSVMDEVLVEIGDDRGEILAIKINLKVQNTDTACDLYYLVDPRSGAEILRRAANKM